MKKHICDFTYEQWNEFILAAGFRRFNADQVWEWIYKRGETDLDKWTNISGKLREFLRENLSFEPLKIIWSGQSKDGTTKFLLGLDDKKSVEAVLIPSKDRLTICLSSQVGCAIGCKFCHTGTMGLTRHLKLFEVVGQWWTLSLWLLQNLEKFPNLRKTDNLSKITNMVYMGQGEPLHNFQTTKEATETFLHPRGPAYGQRKITLSTSGMVPQIEKLGDFPPVNIAISLHAAHDEVRTELMPINKVYDLKRLFGAIKTIPLKGHRSITYEYIMIAGLNDGERDLEGLCTLLDPKVSKINLIPFNEYPESSFKRPSEERIVWFQNFLLGKGYTCTVRATKGQDILAACGQLKSLEDQLNLWSKEAPQTAATP
jgi:23S rRNA (adenine2503-C2)-methyltransferase